MVYQATLGMNTDQNCSFLVTQLTLSGVRSSVAMNLCATLIHYNHLYLEPMLINAMEEDLALLKLWLIRMKSFLD